MAKDKEFALFPKIIPQQEHLELIGMEKMKQVKQLAAEYISIV